MYPEWSHLLLLVLRTCYTTVVRTVIGFLWLLYAWPVTGNAESVQFVSAITLEPINQSINQKRIKVTKVTNVTARPLNRLRYHHEIFMRARHGH